MILSMRELNNESSDLSFGRKTWLFRSPPPYFRYVPALYISWNYLKRLGNKGLLTMIGE